MLCYFCVGTRLVELGWYKDPDEFPTKAVFFTGSALGLVLSTAFSAAVVSALSVPQIPVKDFDGLILSQFKFTHMQESLTMRDLLSVRSQAVPILTLC